MTWIGFAMLVASGLLFLSVLPRQGEARSFFRHSEWRGPFVAVALVAMLMGGVALVIAGLV